MKPTVSLLVRMADRWTAIDPILQENIEADGEILPHLVLADVTRWIASHIAQQHAECGEMLEWLGAEYEAGGSEVKDLIAVSAVEMIPDPGEPGADEMRALLPEVLRGLDPWSPGL